jgi:hypothetical protein
MASGSPCVGVVIDVATMRLYGPEIVGLQVVCD